MLKSHPDNPCHNLGLPSKRDSYSVNSNPAPSNKRKRDSTTDVQPLPKSFVIRPYQNSIYEKPGRFTPIHLIPRAHLSLAFLDTTANLPGLPSNRLFSSYIEILERDNSCEQDTQGTPQVLVVRYETDKTLFAVERSQKGVYSLCRLARWLKEKDISDLCGSSKDYNLSPLQRNVDFQNGSEWWQYAAIRGNGVSDGYQGAPKRLRMVMLRPTPATSDHKSPAREKKTISAVGSEEQTDAKMEPPEVLMDTPLSGQRICDNLATQYLETLYLSQTSLAYFAKGSISRARATFTSAEDSSLHIYDLTTFLRSILLTHASMDKKYREKLPEIIRSLPPGSLSDDDFDEKVSPAKSRKRKPKRMKLSRDGVYPGEEEYVKKWWISDISSPQQYDGETADQRLRRRVGDLRVREALAQLILMLEISALEAMPTYKVPQPENHVADSESRTQNDPQAKPKKRKPKRLQDMNLLIDLLLDKLCIWQSVEQDDSISFQTKPLNYGDALHPNSAKASSGDRLRNFCIEVIVPFYMSRLPDHAVTINKRLGGPVATSPAKRKSTLRQSGELREPDPKRKATDTTKKISQRPAPLLHRSATDSALVPGLKREGSEVPLSAIPFQRSPSTTSSRQTMAQFKRLSQREVDLSTKSSAVDTKIKQKKRVEEELKSAISALKKPNRELAVGGYVDDVERRGLGAAGRSRKPANPSRKILQTVQVAATPKRTRKTEVGQSVTGHHHRASLNREARGELRPPSSNDCIPSSVVRPPSLVVPSTELRDSVFGSAAGVSIAETPSRGPRGKTTSFLPDEESGQQERDLIRKLPPSFKISKGPSISSEQKDTDGIVFATPSKPRASQIDQGPAAILSTPVKTTNIAKSTLQLEAIPSRAAIFATPIKSTTKKLITLNATAGNTAPTGTQESVERSIYSALGWDDDNDLL
ncbi:hypothetical protein K432DRAFT_432987 [Lepidopterella palustris CBS 459.81]|uniref:DNA replication regulator Sld3 C-terminal domain-containing protein n=1 Tax=Lepidopterella palustris CBS 459.81 TaxID=1314670 RepID=A0A8E2EGB2_9PEZI|nr:hypothetical protein K432DRAFT_432987 [Lepidopterella palustris CBS 459.81]